jgi:ribosomal protein S18 acetylase RimI-like enzyme
MLTASKPIIHTATLSEEQHVIAPLTLAFATDPAVRWMYPDPHQYRTFFPSFARAFGGISVALGSAHYVEGFRGAALWLPPGTEPDEEVLGALISETVTPAIQPDVFAVLQQMANYHPRISHWYLPLIGVEPLHQRSGYGTALMEYMLAACDNEGTLAYLEATNPAIQGFYEKLGFIAMGEIQSASSPIIVPMVREPR